jgi:hypothetical protein
MRGARLHRSERISRGSEIASTQSQRAKLGANDISVDFDRNAVRPLSEFHGDPRYAGDLHRADMAWALYAASRGFPEQQIRAEILHARDLSKKGGLRRQLNYAEKAATKALDTVQPIIR